MTVHKLVSQAVDPQASRIILEALFDSKTTTLEDILSEYCLINKACELTRRCR